MLLFMSTISYSNPYSYFNNIGVRVDNIKRNIKFMSLSTISNKDLNSKNYLSITFENRFGQYYQFLNQNVTIEFIMEDYPL